MTAGPSPYWACADCKALYKGVEMAAKEEIGGKEEY